MDFQAQRCPDLRCPLWARLSGLILLSITASAQRYAFKYYGHQQGLNNLAVKCLLQDRTGFLWVGTENGLFRYDSLSFTAYGLEDGLPSSRIASLHETADGALWVGTANGLARREGNRFLEVASGTKQEVWSMASNRAGALFLATPDGLITGVRSPPNREWRFRVVPKPAGLAAPAVYSVLADTNNVIWFGCDLALCRLEDGKISVMGTSAGVRPERWRAILRDHNGNLWLRSPDALLVWRPGAVSFIAAAGPPGSKSGNLCLDRQGRLLVATENGLWILDAGIWQSTGLQRGLPVEAVRCVLEDREGSVWLGLAGFGLVRWIGRDEWESWTRSEGLAGTSPSAMYRDSRGVLWVGTEKGLQQLPAHGRSTRLWTSKDGLAGSRVRAIVGGRAGALWIGCAPGGVSSFDPDTGKIRAYGAESGLTSTNIRQLLWDRDGRMWVITEGPVFRSTLSRDNGRDSPLRFERVIPTHSGAQEAFYSVALDGGGRLWLAGARLWRLENDRWTSFESGGGLKILAPGTDGAMWVSYRESLGVARLTYPGARLQVETFNRAGQLTSDDIRSMRWDALGRLWVGTDYHLNVLENGFWRHLNQSDGLLWDDCVANSLYEDHDQSVWIGTTQGLSHIRSLRLLGMRSLPIVITSAQLGSALFDPATSPVVPYRSRVLQIEFSVLAFRSEDQHLRFHYRLRGMPDDWVETRERKARYAALSPGAYTFEVETRGPAGWSAEPARFSFRIQAPWWRTPWAEGLLLLFLLAAARWLWLWRLHLLMEKQKNLEFAVAERTRELSLEKTHIEAQNQEIEALLVRAQESSRLKSQFLANVSHEIRTPMNGILGMSALGLEAPTPEEQRECFEVVKASADSLLLLLNDILDFSKIEAGLLALDLAPFLLRECLEGAIRTMRAAARRKGLALSWHVAGPVPAVVVGDAIRLRQILLNLVGNAIKFTETGAVTVRAILQSEERDRMQMLFSVNDTGLGIPANQQQLIFKPFCQADGSTTRKYGGTGLGLTISSRLVSLMEGKIWVESRPGEGSTFSFTAQFAKAPRVENRVESLASAGSDEPKSPPLRILLAEDNIVNQKFIVRLLQKHGHQVIVAADGVHAVEMCEKQGFDLVLMDIQMPEMDGFAATAAIRKSERGTGAHVPIIAMTAHAEAGYAETCLARGMDGYIAKPVKPLILFAAIEQFAVARPI